TVSSAVLPSVIGVPALLVLTISSSLPFFTSQVQPEPKLPMAELVKASLNLSKEPHLALIASARAPVGSPPPFGLRQFQKKVWFQTWAALLNNGPGPALLMISSSDWPSLSVPATSSFSLVT